MAVTPPRLELCVPTGSLALRHFDSIGWCYSRPFRPTRLLVYATVSDTSPLDDAIERLCVLDDPVRRAVYRAVREAGQPVTRVEAGERAGISTRLATFHLEKLVDEGFVAATFERAEHASSVGRPAKRYSPTDMELEVSIPPRRYDIAADILASILERVTEATPPSGHIAAVAAEHGQRLGRRVARRSPGDRLLVTLRLLGYEPSVKGDAIVLRNCPFRRAAEAQPEVVCQMNHAFVGGILTGLGTRSRSSVLDREPGRCCVVLPVNRAKSTRA
jgi:predicted ArsR family transcriptional regulator